MSRKKAFSLLVVMVAMAIAAVILSVLYQVYKNFWRSVENPRAMMAMEESTMAFEHRLQRDISETNLQSIRSFPNASDPNSRPALYMESARAIRTSST